jgi:hypothetical protein
MTTRQAKVLIWTAVTLLFLMAAMAPLTHLVGGVSWSSFFSPAAKAAELGPTENLHPAIADPANLQPKRAEEIYQAIRNRVRDNYARSGDPLFLAYQNWKRYTRLPYRSPNHGERFVHHYANAPASAYVKYEMAGPLPVGSIVIKDSFTVTKQGQVMTGPLFMMEKMADGFSSLAGTWRFMMLRPDGSTVGLTGGTNAKAVRFCAECHAKAGKEHDFLYFMPDEARLK